MAAQLCDIYRILLIWNWTHLLVTLASVAFLVSLYFVVQINKIEFKDLGGCRRSSSSSSSSSREEKGYSGGEETGQWLVLRRKFMCKNQGIKIFFFTVDYIISSIICCCSTQNSAFNIESKYQFP